MPQTFSLVTLETDRTSRIGLLVGDRVVDISGALQADAPDSAEASGSSLMLSLLERWDADWPMLQDLAGRVTEGAGVAVEEVLLRAPLPRPVNLYCAFANYVDHMLEMGGTPADKTREDPFIFQAPVTAVSDPGTPIALPAGVTDLDYEGELAAVIGRAARDLSPEEALGCVAGYTIVNDVSIRRGARRGDNGGRPDFLASKGRAGYKPMGPALVPAAFVPDPQNLRLRTWVSGVLKQDSNTAQMIFTVAEQIAHVSRLTGVLPGDVFATGTPAGVGMPRGDFLKAGDVVEVEIEGIGRLSNPVVAG